MSIQIGMQGYGKNRVFPDRKESSVSRQKSKNVDGVSYLRESFQTGKGGSSYEREASLHVYLFKTRPERFSSYRSPPPSKLILLQLGRKMFPKVGRNGFNICCQKLGWPQLEGGGGGGPEDTSPFLLLLIPKPPEMYPDPNRSMILRMARDPPPLRIFWLPCPLGV